MREHGAAVAIAARRARAARAAFAALHALAWAAQLAALIALALVQSGLNAGDAAPPTVAFYSRFGEKGQLLDRWKQNMDQSVATNLNTEPHPTHHRMNLLYNADWYIWAAALAALALTAGAARVPRLARFKAAAWLLLVYCAYLSMLVCARTYKVSSAAPLSCQSKQKTS